MHVFSSVTAHSFHTCGKSWKETRFGAFKLLKCVCKRITETSLKSSVLCMLCKPSEFCLAVKISRYMRSFFLQSETIWKRNGVDLGPSIQNIHKNSLRKTNEPLRIILFADFAFGNSSKSYLSKIIHLPLQILYKFSDELEEHSLRRNRSNSDLPASFELFKLNSSGFQILEF